MLSQYELCNELANSLEIKQFDNIDLICELIVSVLMPLELFDAFIHTNAI